MNKILVVAAHPDDEVLGVGGTIPILKKKGADITVLIVTDGSQTQYDNNSDIDKQKRNELQKAMEILTVDKVIQWDFPDMQLDTIAHYELNKAFEVLLQKEKYDTIFCHSEHDINLDHKFIFNSVMVAARPYPDQSVKCILTYYVNSSTEWGAFSHKGPFNPNVYVNISDTIDLKLKAMEAYKTELREYPHPRSIEGIRIQAASHGLNTGYAYAEPFKLILLHGLLTD